MEILHCFQILIFVLHTKGCNFKKKCVSVVMYKYNYQHKLNIYYVLGTIHTKYLAE